MGDIKGRQFRKPEVGGSIPPCGSVVGSENGSGSNQTRPVQVASGPYLVTENDDAELLKKAVMALAAIPMAGLPRRSSPHHHLYFLRASNGLVKVGHSGDLYTRLAGLRVGSPIPLEVVGFARIGSKWFEKAAHAYLDGTRSHGEWFLPTARFLRLLAASKGRAWARLTKRHWRSDATDASRELRVLADRFAPRGIS